MCRVRFPDHNTEVTGVGVLFEMSDATKNIAMHEYIISPAERRELRARRVPFEIVEEFRTPE